MRPSDKDERDRRLWGLGISTPRADADVRAMVAPGPAVLSSSEARRSRPQAHAHSRRLGPHATVSASGLSTGRGLGAAPPRGHVKNTLEQAAQAAAAAGKLKTLGETRGMARADPAGNPTATNERPHRDALTPHLRKPHLKQRSRCPEKDLETPPEAKAPLTPVRHRGPGRGVQKERD